VNLKLDENLGHTAAELFRQAGHGVETVHTQKLSGAPDAEVIALCRREQRCLVTLDLDFSNPLMFKITGKLWTVQRGRIREYRPDPPEEEREDA
jgi:predicted nuclease of predicted toxin-antitoxin system